MLIKFTPDSIAEQLKNEWFPDENLDFYGNYEFTIALSNLYSGEYTSEDIHEIEYYINDELHEQIHNKILSR